MDMYVCVQKGLGVQPVEDHLHTKKKTLGSVPRTLLPKSYYDGSFIASTVKDPSMLTESLPSAPPSHHTTVLSSRRAPETENVLPTYLLRCVSSHFPNQNINSMRTLLFS